MTRLEERVHGIVNDRAVATEPRRDSLRTSDKPLQIGIKHAGHAADKPRTPTGPRLTELDLARQIRDLAHALGWLHVHFRPAQTKHGWRTPFSGDPGFPDIVLARHGRVLFLELKQHGKHPRPEQQTWLDNLNGYECQALVVRPRDFDRIVETLR